MPEGFASSLVNFVNQINNEIKKEDINPIAVAPIKDSVNELAKTTTEVMHGEVKEEKRMTTIREKLKGVALSLVKLSPKIARTLAGFTPLAPFSELIGEGFDKMIEGAIKQ